jgi:hypothetical protein
LQLHVVVGITLDQTDLNKRKDNGLTTASWFIFIIVLQTFSLSIALGAPWRETIYFILLMTVQVFSGASIWMHLRRQANEFSLPDLIVFGFALSYGVVGIVQLILQPLLPNAHLVSVLSPGILAIVIALSKQKTKFDIKIKHSDRSVLFIALFAAPLAMSFGVIELIPAYVAPLLLLLVITHKFEKSGSNRKAQTNLKYLVLSGYIVLSTVLFHQLSFRLRNGAVALSLLGDDELFDFAHSRGYTNWGIYENINFAGDNIRLYKFAQVWLGTFLESVPTSVLLTSTLIPIIFFTLISLAFWSLTFLVSESKTIANIGSILIYLQASLPEPYMIERRPLYLISCFLIVVGLNFRVGYMNALKSRYFILVFVFSFVFFSTRLQYATLFFVSIIIFELLQLRNKLIFLRSVLFEVLCIMTGSIASFFVFYQKGIANTEDIYLRDFAESLSSIANSTGFRIIFLLLIFALLVGFTPNYLLSAVMVTASILFYLLIPRLEHWRYPIEIVLIASTPLIAVLLSQSLLILNEKILTVIFSSALCIGFANRFFYDLLKWRQPDELSPLSELLQKFTTEGWPQFWFSAIQLFVLVLIIYAAIRYLKRPVFFASCVALIFSYYFGVLLATDLRGFTTNGEFSASVLVHTPSATTRWIEQEDYSSALEYFVLNSGSDDIFATNAHKYYEDYSRFGSSLIITSLTGRRSLAEAPNFDRSTPSDSSDEFFIRTRASIEFPRIPSASNFRTLQDENVKWFIVDLENTDLRDWSPWAEIRFINKKVAVLALTDDPIALE